MTTLQCEKETPHTTPLHDFHDVYSYDLLAI